MVPTLWNQTVTLFHRSMENDIISWKRIVLHDCFAQRKEQSVNVDLSRRDGHRIVCRIPAPAPLIGLGDIVVLGTSRATIDEYTSGMTSAEFLTTNHDKAFTVTEIHDNTAASVRIKHVYLGGV